MKLLVVGSGGREHALAWKLAQSPRVQMVYVAPGNGGTAQDERLLNVDITDPAALADFADYNDALHFADTLLRQLKLEGELQIASFHPNYQFDDAESDDIENFTNRAPYPIFHLLREASIERAVAAFPDAADIYERNMATLRGLGHAGWLEHMKRDGGVKS